MGQKQDPSPPNNVTQSADIIAQLVKNVTLVKNAVPATVISDGRRRGAQYVVINSQMLQEDLARFYNAGFYYVSVTVKVNDEILSFVGRLLKRPRGFSIYPLAEAQKLLRQLYQQQRSPERKRNPLVILILDLRPRL